MGDISAVTEDEGFISNLSIRFSLLMFLNFDYPTFNHYTIRTKKYNIFQKELSNINSSF